MGIFDKIKGAIWGQAKAAEAAPAPTTTAATANPAPAPTPAPSATTAATSPATSAPSAPVDIAAILDAAVKNSDQKLDWKHSIVDLMKALGMSAMRNQMDLVRRARCRSLTAEIHWRKQLPGVNVGKQLAYLSEALEARSFSSGEVMALMDCLLLHSFKVAG